MSQKGVPQIPPVGRCIYCDDPNEPLGKEHVIPKSLGGPITLRKASCKLHEKVTRDLETIIARDVFGDLRWFTGLRIKEPHRHIPPYGGKGHIFLPDFPTAKLLAPWNGLQEGRTYFRQLMGDAARRIPVGPPAAQFNKEFNLDVLARFVAKMALGYAVVAAGMDGFDPAIRDVVTGVEIDWTQRVGGTPPHEVRFHAPSSVAHRILAFDYPVEGRDHLIVQVQLFAFLETPIFSVVVGEFLEAGKNKLFGTEHRFHT